MTKQGFPVQAVIFKWCSRHSTVQWKRLKCALEIKLPSWRHLLPHTPLRAEGPHAGCIIVINELFLLCQINFPANLFKEIDSLQY